MRVVVKYPFIHFLRQEQRQLLRHLHHVVAADVRVGSRVSVDDALHFEPVVRSFVWRARARDDSRHVRGVARIRCRLLRGKQTNAELGDACIPRHRLVVDAVGWSSVY